MPRTIWFYLFTPEGEFQPLSTRRWEQFFHGELDLPTAVRSRVRFAEILVNNENRRPVAVESIRFVEMPLDSAGKADKLRLARSATRLLEDQGGEDFSWSPTPTAVAELHGMINRRARAHLVAGPTRFHVVDGGRSKRSRRVQ